MMSQNSTQKTKRRRAVPISVCILIFLLAFAGGVASKFLLKPAWMDKYNVSWSDDLGKRVQDISYADGEANKFDLYLPKDNTHKNYGLAVYLHAGGFTSGDKSDDEDMLAWLCSKGYVAAGINYTLRTEDNDASVLSQSNEIKAAVPAVIKAAKEQGYNINKMCVSGGSAGHALAMIYAYRDGSEAPVPVVLTFGGVGPSSFHVEDWGVFGLGKESDEQLAASAAMFSIMGGVQITPDEIKDDSYLEKIKPIAAAQWVGTNPVPSVVAYGTHDKMQPFLASIKLKAALEQNNVDFKYYELTHSGHALQNDNKIYEQWMSSVDEYLDKYMPVEK